MPDCVFRMWGRGLTARAVPAGSPTCDLQRIKSLIRRIATEPPWLRGDEVADGLGCGPTVCAPAPKTA